MRLEYAVLALVFAGALAAAEDIQAGDSTGEMSPYECVRYVGYDPDSFIYVYQRGHGSGWVESARTVAHRKGIIVIPVDSGLLTDGEVKLLQCFFGRYGRENLEFFKAPRVLCPRTGLVSEVYRGGTPPMGRLRVLASRCR